MSPAVEAGGVGAVTEVPQPAVTNADSKAAKHAPARDRDAARRGKE
jgi:hypothetical protein